MKLALVYDGLTIGGYRPIVLNVTDVRLAERVILIDSQLPASAACEGANIERWTGFPPMREEYLASRAALRAKVEDLVSRLAAAEQ